MCCHECPDRLDLPTLAALRPLGVPCGAEDVVLQVLNEKYSFSELRWLVEQGNAACAGFFR